MSAERGEEAEKETRVGADELVKQYQLLLNESEITITKFNPSSPADRLAALEVALRGLAHEDLVPTAIELAEKLKDESDAQKRKLYWVLMTRTLRDFLDRGEI